MSTFKIEGKFDFTVLFNLEDQIYSICKPLNKSLKITYFHHCRMFADDSHFSLSTNAPWLKYFYETFFSYIATFENNPQQCFNQITIWKVLHDQYSEKLYRKFSEKYDTDHGITITRRQKDFCDFYHFGTTPNNCGAENIYLNNLPILKNFLFYYHERANKLIQIASRHKTFIPKERGKIWTQSKKEAQNNSLSFSA